MGLRNLMDIRNLMVLRNFMVLRNLMDIRNLMVLRNFMDIRNLMVVITVIRAAVLVNIHCYDGEQVLILGFFILILIAILWWRDVIREATFLGNHTINSIRDFNEGYFLKIINIRNNKQQRIFLKDERYYR